MRKVEVDDNLEQKIFHEGYKYVVGIDEVGRGCWAGPVVVGAFIFNNKSPILPQVNDSKKLTINQREKVFEMLQRGSFSIGLATAQEIDRINIVRATRLAIKRALDLLNLDGCKVLIDGYFKSEFDFDNECIKSGDEKHYSIAAASILAKVLRDNLMSDLAQEYPEYGFESHVGYGTKRHREALERFGICDIHRKSYMPIRRLLEDNKY